MPFLHMQTLPVRERLPGWRSRAFHSATMTVVHYDFVAGAAIPEHHHQQEEIWQVVSGTLEVTIDGVSAIGSPGVVAIVPTNARHAVKALTDGSVIIVSSPLRHGFD